MIHYYWRDNLKLDVIHNTVEWSTVYICCSPVYLVFKLHPYPHALKCNKIKLMIILLVSSAQEFQCTNGK